MELMPQSSPLYPYVSIDPDRMSGDPVFRGTRVLVRSLFDYLKGGDDLDTFLDDFEGVTREQAQAVLSFVEDELSSHLRAA